MVRCVRVEVDNPICMVLAPKGLAPDTCLRSAERSGALGVWQVSPGLDEPLLAAEFERLRGRGIGRFAIAVSTKAEIEHLRAVPCDGISHIIAPANVLEGAGNLLRSFDDGIEIWAEVTGWSKTLAKLPKRVAGFVLKGHECAGLVSEQTTFVLLQEFGRKTEKPLIARGGITPSTAAAAAIAGASGVMLDDQIMLLPEVGLKDSRLRQRIDGMSGGETVQVECPVGGTYLRGFALNQRQAEQALISRMQDEPESLLEDSHGFDWSRGEIMPGGQGLVLASGTLRRHRTLGRLIAAIRQAWTSLPEAAADRAVLREGGPLSETLGTRFPVLQGPMTRVSDVSDFFVQVADGGGLPFAALALLKGAAAEDLLSRTEAQMQGRPWGVGLLGFAGQEVLAPQFEAVEKHRPDFAIVAGARVDQMHKLEGWGIKPFAHVSSAALLSHYLDEGVTRIIIEGRECGGHIGPLSSFVLWSAILDEMERHPVTQKTPGTLKVVFAGGIHDELSAAMVATLAEPLAARGVQIGVLMGTAYLFTPEIVEAGAIVPDYQQVALSCGETLALWEGPGFASRCAVTPITDEFRAKRWELQAQNASVPEIRKALEHYTLGRLRMATKGLARTGPEGKLTEIDEDQRRREGMYMIGQVAALHDKVQTIAELHDTVSNGSVDLLLERTEDRLSAAAHVATPGPCDIAIVGMSTLLPDTDTLDRYWRRILSGESAIKEIPADRWSLAGYFSEDRDERDSIYSRRGGFLPDVVFDPLKYGIPPASIPSIDPMQLLALEVVSDALDNAGLGSELPANKERMSVVFGFSGGLGEAGSQYATRSEMRRLLGDVPEEVLDRLPEWTEDSFAGLLPNVAAGRIANRFDLGGTNQIVDAACASSLAAVYSAVQELETGRADAVIAGGVDTLQSPFGYLCFAKTKALSPRGVCNTFDADADGIVISEGLAAVVLKRLSDAEKDGDRIFAVIKGIGASSDGRAKGLTAPLPKGQKRAFRRAYEQAGFAPGSVQLFEAHGTGTVAGDKAELETVSGILADSDIPDRSVAIGSIKTLIGHTKATAGIAGLIKVALGLHHQVLPPHALVKSPNAVFAAEDTPLFLSQAPRPWIVTEDQPRRAGVSAFGFGGTNFHVALEEYADAGQIAPRTDAGSDIVPFTFAADSRDGLGKALNRLSARLKAAPETPLPDLAAEAFNAEGDVRIGFVAETHEELAGLANAALAFVASTEATPPEGLFFSDAPALLSDGKLAFLFSGQGAQYPDMHRQTALIAPQLTEAMCRAETLLADTPTFEKLGRPLARLVYPGDAFVPQDRKRQMAALTATEVAQPALGAIETGLSRFLSGIGVAPDMVAGHSYGELAALCAAGALGFDDLIHLSEARGRAMVENADPEQPGAMLAVKADAEATRASIGHLYDVTIANLNSPSQTVIAGSVSAMENALEVLKEAGLAAVKVPVSQAFHSPLMAPARDQFAKAVSAAAWQTPRIPVYANVTAEPHIAETIGEVMTAHLVSPVDFVTQTRNMVRDGARVFVEVGPKSILADRVPEIIGDANIRSIPLDAGDGSARALIDGLVQLFVEGAAVDLPSLLSGLARPGPRTTDAPGPNDWLLNGAYARRADAPRRHVEPPVISPIAAAAPLPAASYDNEELEFMEIKSDPFFPPGTTPDRPDDMMTSYHRMMTEFLRVQESVMRTYLQTGGAAAAPGQMPQMPAAPMPAAPQPVPTPAEVTLPTITATPEPAPAAQPEPAAAPAAPAPAAEATSPPAPAEATRDTTLAAFVEIVAEKTGYPADALEPDQALEADLGIDSIKRMEILSTLQKSLPDRIAGSMRGGMETISQLATMREIVDFVFDNGGDAAAGTADAPEGSGPFDLTGEAETTATAVLPRFVQVPFSEASGHVPSDLPDTALAVVTPATDGFHQAVLAELKRRSIEAHAVPEALLSADPETGALTDWFAALPLADRPLVLIHCATRAVLDDETLTSLPKWQDAHETGTKAVFHLLQAAQPWLQSGGRFLAVMQTGGYFGRRADQTDTAMPSGAGVVGLVKALGHEWPECSLKIVDLDPKENGEAQAAHILSEVSMLPGRREIGYPGGVRTIFRTEAAATEPPIEPDLLITDDWVVLASGGARGITAECLRPLASSGATLVLLGRSPRPEPEPAVLRDLDTTALRAHFLAEARAGGEKPRPAEIEAQVNRHLALRDMDSNLRDFEDMGARVDYRQVDVCDAEAVRRLCADLLREYGRIDMLVHGAGLIEDTLFAKKTRTSFDRVFDTKVDSALVLVEAVRNPNLKGICFFTSVAGRYGNPGQSDYAAANETLNFYARALHRKGLPNCRVKAINWGPWDATTTGAGMVTDSTRSQFLSRGIGMVEPVPGREFFLREMFWANPDQVETVAWVADGETMEGRVCALPADPTAPPAPTGLLLLDGSWRDGDTLRWRFDMVSAPYTDDHRFDGHAVMPMAGMMQAFSELPAAFGIDRPVVELRDLQMLQGITMRDGPAEVVFELSESADGVLNAQVFPASGGKRCLYRASLVLGDALPASDAAQTGNDGIRSWPEMSVREIYRFWLSHGPRFQTIDRIDALDQTRIRAVIKPSTPADFVPQGAGKSWTYDPGMIDGMLQMLWVWLRAEHNISGLPLGAASIRRCAGDLARGPLSIEIDNISLSDTYAQEADLRAFDADGRLVYGIDRFRVQAAPALNRLGGGWPGGERPVETITRKVAE